MLNSKAGHVCENKLLYRSGNVLIISLEVLQDKQNDMQNIRIVKTAGNKVVCQQMSLDDLYCAAVNRELSSLVCLLLTQSIPSIQSLSCSPQEDNAECQ